MEFSRSTSSSISCVHDFHVIIFIINGIKNQYKIYENVNIPNTVPHHHNGQYCECNNRDNRNKRYSWNCFAHHHAKVGYWLKILLWGPACHGQTHSNHKIRTSRQRIVFGRRRSISRGNLIIQAHKLRQNNE